VALRHLLAAFRSIGRRSVRTSNTDASGAKTRYCRGLKVLDDRSFRIRLPVWIDPQPCAPPDSNLYGPAWVFGSLNSRRPRPGNHGGLAHVRKGQV
jgi:hypothetical protein